MSDEHQNGRDFGKDGGARNMKHFAVEERANKQDVRIKLWSYSITFDAKQNKRFPLKIIKGVLFNPNGIRKT